MNIGIPKEVASATFENRVGLAPDGVGILVAEGHRVYVERGAGDGSGFSDEDYRNMGAEVVYSAEEAWGRADIVAKIRAPIPAEYPYLRPGQIIFGFLHMAVAPRSLVEALLAARVTAIAYETIQHSDGSLPVVIPMSEIAGRMAPLVAGELLMNTRGGKGILLGAVPAIPSAQVGIVGGGVVGYNAARVFMALGAQVTIKDLHELPKIRDSISYLYLEHGNVEQTRTGIGFFDRAKGRTLIPTAALAVLMLGPGTSITHAAVKTIAAHGCLILWTGEEGVRFYAQGCAETRKAYRLLKQAELVSDPEKRTQVVLRMYRFRFGNELDPGMSLPQIRGYEGVRVRTAYARASETYGVPWQGRYYDRENWSAGDPVNRALSAANACLNGLCHAAIVSAGYSPGLGFIHTGKQLSFVYDIADLYKVEITIPLAFRIVAESPLHVESRVRRACRDAFREQQLLGRVVPDIDNVLGLEHEAGDEGADVDSDQALPHPLWAPLLAGGEEESTEHGRDDPGDGVAGAAGGAEPLAD